MSSLKYERLSKLRIIIDGESKEIANLLLAIGGQQNNKDFEKVTNHLYQLMKTASKHDDIPLTSQNKQTKQQ